MPALPYITEADVAGRLSWPAMVEALAAGHRLPRAQIGDLFLTRGDDTLRVELEIEDAVATDTRESVAERGETGLARVLPRPWFVQMKGRARISGRVDGRPVSGEGTGFFETYR